MYYLYSEPYNKTKNTIKPNTNTTQTGQVYLIEMHRGLSPSHLLKLFGIVYVASVVSQYDMLPSHVEAAYGMIICLKSTSRDIFYSLDMVT